MLIPTCRRWMYVACYAVLPKKSANGFCFWICSVYFLWCCFCSVLSVVTWSPYWVWRSLHRATPADVSASMAARRLALWRIAEKEKDAAESLSSRYFRVFLHMLQMSGAFESKIKVPLKRNRSSFGRGWASCLHNFHRINRKKNCLRRLMDIEGKTALECFEYVHPVKTHLDRAQCVSWCVSWPMARRHFGLYLIPEVQTIVRSVNEFKLLWRNLQWVCSGAKQLLDMEVSIRISLWCVSISLIVILLRGAVWNDARSMTSTQRFIYLGKSLVVPYTLLYP